MEHSCKTKYPIVLIHGLGFRDRKHLNYWGRIPKSLRECGAILYHANQDSHGSIETNAWQIKVRVEAILKETNSDKVNLIAHSKGGLDARYMISMLGMHSKIASLTTISTPHHGVRTMDVILKLPKFMIRIAAFFSNIWYKALGDKEPDSITVFHQFSTAFALDFNQTVLDCKDVYYQSFAFVMKNMFSDIFLFFPYIIVKFFEGENDGLVTPAAATWTNFRGVVKSVSNRGISHCDEVDMRRHRFSKKKNTGRVSDMVHFYIDLVSGLRERGL